MSYLNLANYYFNSADFESAIENAEKALALNRKLYQASGLLAIIYSLKGEKEPEEKYSHIAISTGENPEDLQLAKKHFKSVQTENETEKTKIKFSSKLSLKILKKRP